MVCIRRSKRLPDPHSVAFHPGGRFVLATDYGCDRITVFESNDGRLRRVNTVEMSAGSGASHLAIHRQGKLFSVAGELRASLSWYSFDDVEGDASYIGSQRLPARPESFAVFQDRLAFVSLGSRAV